MIRTISSIREKLATEYPPGEIEGFIALLFGQVCGFSKTDLIVKRDYVLSSEEKERVHSIVTRLLKHEPIQYILGETGFYGLKFWINPSVLIPRNETEELVDLIVKQQKENGSALIIIDLGTGSACIAVALKKSLAGSEVWACDISEEALALASKNALRNDAEVHFFHYDILSGFNLNKNQQFDIIVSNPPYVTVKEKSMMHRNVLEYEPHLALFVPDHDPLVFYRSIGLFACQYLKEDGKLFLEINEAYGRQLVDLFKEQGFGDIVVYSDINGKSRILEAKKRPVSGTL